MCLCVFAEFTSPSHLILMNRTASVSGSDRMDSLSFSGSNSQLNNSNPMQQYTPDFYVRALTDLQFVKVGLGSSLYLCLYLVAVMFGPRVRPRLGGRSKC